MEVDKDSKNDNDDNISCVALNSSIDLLKTIYEDKNYKALIKELFGFYKYGLYYISEDDGEKYYIASNMAYNQIYNCKDGTYNYGYDKNTF